MTLQKLTYGLLVTLLSVIGYMAMAGLNNNTAAMDRLAESLEKIEERIGMHEVEIRQNKLMNEFNSRRLDKGGL